MCVLFKRKDNEEIEMVIESDEDLENRLQTQLKRQRRHYYLKQVGLGILLLMVSAGGLKSLFTSGRDAPYVKAVNDYAFVDEYMGHYLRYPQTEEDSEYLQLFTVNSNWRSEYDNQRIETAEMSDLNIYHVVHNDNETNTYYFKTTLNTQTKDGQKENLPLYMKLTAVQQSDAYLVSEPIDMAYTQTVGLSDEDKKVYEKTQNMEGDDCSQAEKEELENTVQLFLKTYVSDFEQARLLMMDPASLDPLDPSTELTLENVSSVRKNSKEYMLSADTIITSGQSIKQRRTYCFVIDQASNKILRMEEY